MNIPPPLRHNGKNRNRLRFNSSRLFYFNNIGITGVVNNPLLQSPTQNTIETHARMWRDYSKPVENRKRTFPVYASESPITMKTG